MSYRIIYHPAIRQDVARLTHWFMEHGSRDTSRRRLTEVRNFIRLLSEMPHRGSTRDDALAGLRSVPVNGKTTITFIVDDERRELFIYAISHAGQDWARLVRQRRLPVHADARCPRDDPPTPPMNRPPPPSGE